MPLSADPVSRIRKHTRSDRVEGYARARVIRAGSAQRKPELIVAD